LDFRVEVGWSTKDVEYVERKERKWAFCFARPWCAWEKGRFHKGHAIYFMHKHTYTHRYLSIYLCVLWRIIQHSCFHSFIHSYFPCFVFSTRTLTFPLEVIQ
jgi:hypothetical protein